MPKITESAVRDRETIIADLLRPLGTRPLSKTQALQAAKLLDVHWTTVYRLRKRFLADPVASAVKPRERGPKVGSRRLGSRAEMIIDEVLTHWLPGQRLLAHPLADLTLEIQRRCCEIGVTPPGRRTVSRRWAAHREAENLAHPTKPPGNFVVENPMDVVQVDHTQADVLIVDTLSRRPIGRPWLSLAIDVATRCVVGFHVGMERPGASTVALLLTRVALPKSAWLESLGIPVVDWPMHGVPKVLHLDNAAEFKSRALRTGCSEYGIDLMYRPVGRPHFGGHIERLNRTLMERVHGLPGTTGSSPKGRKARSPEEHAALTLHEFEQWLALEIGQRYHQSAHRGLHGATPASRWTALNGAAAARTPLDTPEAQWKFLLQFLPVVRRTIQSDGLTLFHLRYWHPVFSAWRLDRRAVTIRYHPEDLSRIFISVPDKSFIEVRFADLRHPPISLREQRTAVRHLRDQGQKRISESMIFRAIEEQRSLIAQAQRDTRHAKIQKSRPKHHALRTIPQPFILRPEPAISIQQTESVDYSKPAPAYDAELW
ncbi:MULTISPECIES: Mu transposase C-terminal domain-containing protein [unclassified Burkholderia]|uniref:Mu transposase C-terminal domain-containing protein n=1 Tax=unclassified Burkholderia TaxID=2613784 RepID=UPI0007535DF4|nr:MULTISPECIES: Mu transposase C-terminal domain-containing protein [unclassified Burkholderia]KUY50660.1 transposase [Burkholderia sp. RF2-non_BP3]